MSINFLDEYKKIREEFNSDFELNEFNCEEQTFKAPGLKAKWLGILETYSFEELKLKREIKKLKSGEKQSLRTDLKVDISEEELEKFRFKVSKTVEEKEERLENVEFIIKFLEERTKYMSFFSIDIKNTIELKKLG